MSMMVSRFLAAMDLKGLRQCGGSGGDAGAFVLGVARVQHQHRDVLLDGRKDGGWMQHLRAKIGQLGSFFEADGRTRSASGQMRGSVVMMPLTSVQISIDSGVQAAADQGGGEIRTAAAEGGGDALRR